MPETKRLATQLRHKTVLVELSQLRAETINEALGRILPAVARTLSVERVSYWAITTDQRAIECQLMFSAGSGQLVAGGRLEREKYPAYFDALLTNKAIVAHEAVTDERTREFAVGYFDVYDIHSMLDVPVWREGALAGVLCCEHVSAQRTWTNEEEDFAASAANIIALNLETIARARAEERYRLISRASGEVLWEWDFETDAVEWSDRLEACFGHRVSAETSNGHWWSEQIHPSDCARVTESIRNLIASGRTSWEMEYRFRRADDSHAYVLDRGLVSRDATGRAKRMTGTMRDVTRRKNLEERLLVADRMASLGTLAAGIAHEINNPLTYVYGNLEHALDALKDAPKLDPGVLEALRDAQVGASRVRDIVRELKLFSRTTKDDADALVDVNRVVDRSIAIAQNEIKQHNAKLVRRLDTPPPVQATEAKLGQVVLNLLVNAAHAVANCPEDKTPEITVSTGTLDDGRAFFAVADNGAGISAEARNRIFDPFFTTKPVGTGTGLGLSICHSIVTTLGGEIDVESAPGQGSVFRVVLPAAVTTEDPAAKVVAETVASGARLRVLVIDDEPGVRALVRRLLKTDFDVEASESANLALPLLMRHAFDAILCDIAMPGTSGIEFHKRLLKTRPELASRMVFMTGGTFTAEARHYIEGSSQPILEKPFDAVDLRLHLGQVVTRNGTAAAVPR